MMTADFTTNDGHWYVSAPAKEWLPTDGCFVISQDGASARIALRDVAKGVLHHQRSGPPWDLLARARKDGWRPEGITTAELHANILADCNGKSKEAFQAVAIVNDAIREAYGEPEEAAMLLTFSSDGVVSWVEFLGATVWHSENEERDFDEAKDEWEPMRPFLLKAMTKQVKLADDMIQNLGEQIGHG